MCTMISWKTVWTMCLVSTIRVAYKQALQSGRVYKQQQRLPHDPTPDPPRGLGITSPEFFELVNPLTEQQWQAFQAKERAYRSSLVSEDHLEKEHYVSSADPGSWIRLIKLLIGIFFNNGVFTSESRRGIPFGFPLLKFVARVLKKLPTKQPLPEPLTPALACSWIEVQLRFLRDTVQPSLTATRRQQQRRKVSRDKLSYLWQHKQSRAIQIILNNSEYPDPPPCPDNCEEVQLHYENKCRGRVSMTDPLPPPPWRFELPPTEPVNLPDVTRFTQAEVETVLRT